MARQALNLGDSANTGTGETLRSAGLKIDANFQDLIASSSPVMPGSRTYYVSFQGSDSANGLTPSTPFLTLQKAVDTICNSAVAGSGDVIIQLADGTYNLSEPVYVDTFAGDGNGIITIQGNLSTPANVIINSSVSSLIVAVNGRVQVSGVELRCTAAGMDCLCASRYGHVIIGTVLFGTSTGANHINAALMGRVTSGDYSIVGSAARHYYASIHGIVRVSGTVTLTGTPAFTTFAESESRSAIVLNGSTFTGSATGKRYNATGNGMLVTSGLTLPGDVAGTTSTGGQYT